MNYLYGKYPARLNTKQIAMNLNRLLSDDRLAIDIKTSRELFGLMGGGVRLNGEYVPVEIPKVYEAILAQGGE